VETLCSETTKGEIVTALLHRLSCHLANFLRRERGDVPGWVLITLMTAGLVVALWALAGPSLGQVFNQAVTRVVSF
jgi:hypothetical protein